jgi:hypothetical protein
MLDSTSTEQIALYAQQVIHVQMASIRHCVPQERIHSEDQLRALLAPKAINAQVLQSLTQRDCQLNVIRGPILML